MSHAEPSALTCKVIFLLVLSMTIFLSSPQAFAAQYYVATNGNDSNPGTISEPWQTIHKAASTLQPGDTVYVRAGTYNEDIMPVNAGSANNYITYSAYPGEAVTVKHNPSQDNIVVELENRSYITINGFIIDGNTTGGLISGYNNNGYIIISNNTMKNCADNQYGILVSKGTNWHIFNNNMTFLEPSGYTYTGVDAINMKSNNHLVEGNTIINGPHSAIEIAGGSYIVIRNNTLSNIYNQVVTSTGSSGVWAHNILFENNSMTGGGTSKSPIDAGLAQGIQLGSQQTIIRHNVFSSAYSAGVELSFYYTDNEATDVHGNRIYNNTMFGNNGAGIAISRYNNPSVASDNVFKNNIFRMNRYANSDSNPQQLYYIDYASGMANFDYSIGSSVVSFNAFSASTTGLNVIGGTSTTGPNVVNSLSWFQTKYPSYISNNIETNPMFINETGGDFHLAAGSPLIGAGSPLTTAVGAGSGTQLTVADAKYFSDGLGVVDPDWIKIGNQNPVQITSINYVTNTISLASSITWNNADGVNLYKDSGGNVVLNGNNPDIGALAYPVLLGPPAGLRLIQ
jgi:hypothetical protein